MNTINKKGFTLTELVIVIAVIAIISTVLIGTFSNVIGKAEESADLLLLANINKVLQMEEVFGNTNTVKDVYDVLAQNGITDFETNQSGFEFVYNKQTNRFEYLKNGWKNINRDIYANVSDYRSLFGATIESNKATGFRTYNGITTYTYKFINKSTHEVITGDTITENNTLTYWLHVPKQYNPRITYPLITYIHGSGGCLFLQENCDGVTVDVESDSAYWANNTSYWMNMQNPNNSNTSLKTSLRDDFTSIAANSAFGGTWDSHFMNAWLAWVKAHPEDDAFIIFAELNDEIWFDNLGTYNIEGKTCEMLCVYNSYKAGADYGETLAGGSSRYNTTYVAQKLGPNVWFQLLTQLQDDLIYEYNIDHQYVIGASLGGISTIDLVSNYPTRYKAAFPCATPCADISEDNIARIKVGGTEIHAYHGASDGLVSSKPIQAFCDALNDAGGKATFISVGGVGHASTPFANYFDEIIQIICK